jgi:putative peptidoglycan binding protein
MAFGTSTWLSKIAAVASLMAVTLLTCAWVFYADDRLISHSARVGTLAVDMPEGSGTGTAFLVDECGILTNFHVVFGPWYVTVRRPPSHAFVGTFTLTEVTLPDGSHPTAHATPVIWGDYIGPDRQTRVPENDWVYLTLDSCLGSRYGYFDLHFGYGQEPLDLNVSAIGYSANRQMTDPSCTSRTDPAAPTKAWLHDCALLLGDSGGPIIRGGTMTVVALASGYRSVSGNKHCLAADRGDPLLTSGRGCANIAVSLTDAIREQVTAAHIAVGLQRMLTTLGYNTGPIGTIEAPEATAAIRQAEYEMGFPVTGKPDCAFYKVLQLRLAVEPRT